MKIHSLHSLLCPALLAEHRACSTAIRFNAHLGRTGNTFPLWACTGCSCCWCKSDTLSKSEDPLALAGPRLRQWREEYTRLPQASQGIGVPAAWPHRVIPCRAPNLCPQTCSPANRQNWLVSLLLWCCLDQFHLTPHPWPLSKTNLLYHIT